MLLTACFRFSGLKWLNKIAVPLLGVVLAYSLIYNLASGNGAALVGYQPAAPIGLVGGISLTVGSFVVAAAISGDYCRFAKSRNDVVKSSILGVLPAGLVVLMLGGILAICTGSYDISVFWLLGPPMFPTPIPAAWHCRSCLARMKRRAR